MNHVREHKDRWKEFYNSGMLNNPNNGKARATLKEETVTLCEIYLTGPKLLTSFFHVNYSAHIIVFRQIQQFSHFIKQFFCIVYYHFPLHNAKENLIFYFLLPFPV